VYTGNHTNASHLNENVEARCNKHRCSAAKLEPPPKGVVLNGIHHCACVAESEKDNADGSLNAKPMFPALATFTHTHTHTQTAKTNTASGNVQT